MLFKALYFYLHFKYIFLYALKGGQNWRYNLEVKIRYRYSTALVVLLVLYTAQKLKLDVTSRPQTSTLNIHKIPVQHNMSCFLIQQSMYQSVNMKMVKYKYNTKPP